MKILLRAIMPAFLLCSVWIFAQGGASSCAELQANFQQYQSCATSIPFTNSVNNTSAENFDTSCIGEPLQGPTWFFMKIKTSGSIQLKISQVSNNGNGTDVDFVLWGPFPNLNSICGQLNQLREIDCSWSAAAIEQVTLPNAVAGQLYVLLVDNYSNVPGEITITQTGGTGSSDCGFLSAVDIQDDMGNDIEQISFCTPDTRNLVATVESDDFPGNAADLRFNYKWYKDNVVVSTVTASPSNSNILNISQSGTYRVEMSAYDSTDPAVVIDNLEVYTDEAIAITSPVITPPDPIRGCGNPDAVFNLTARNSQITNSNSAYSVTFYESQNDMDNGIGIPNPNAYTSGSRTILVRVVDPQNSSCPVTTSLTLEVRQLPGSAVNPEAIQYCDDSGYTVFDLTQHEEQMAGNTPSGISFRYYINLDDAEANNDYNIPNPQAFKNTEKAHQVIYVRINSTLNNDSETGIYCYRILEQEIYVRHSPFHKVRQFYYVCIDIDGNVVNPALIDSGLSQGNYDFIWFNGFDAQAGNEIIGANGPVFTTEHEGDYSVRITDLAYPTLCQTVANFTVRNSLVPFSLKGNPAELVAFDTDNTITAVVTPPSDDFEYSLDNTPWQQSNVFTDVKEGIYNLRVRNQYGCGELSTMVVVADYPRFFTPNGDGYNDYWNIGGRLALDQSNVFVYDRFGKLITELTANETGWDGTYNGRPVPADDYWFRINYTVGGQAKEFLGHFSLKR
ncbi:hypothetical protein HYN48_01520 [Flavobacterium magnum]|uniref:Ig-like domain-containing protein n=1 Tax=Flavobacterium magnum TaxID=2162713 RepID=A0A2S0RCQ4_9FLAO|nr:T9SS type B sorting domain-containing protein [Flavobacterium magnum]AWA28871.1 hypothetical protein HYN48_01520 [Flavobacterium magnum]